MGDRRPERVERLARSMTDHADVIGKVIFHRRHGAPVDISRPEISIGGGGENTPTESEYFAWVNAQVRDGSQFIRLLTGHLCLPSCRQPCTRTMNVRGAAEIAAQLDRPVEGYKLHDLYRTIHEGQPDRRDWRAAIRDVALAWHEAAESIHDGWRLLHEARWVKRGGVDVLDELAEVEALRWVERIERLEQRVASMRRRITPAPAQRQMRPCQCDEDCGQLIDPAEGQRVTSRCKQRAYRRRKSAQQTESHR